MFIVPISWNSGKTAVAPFVVLKNSGESQFQLRSGDMSAKLSPKRTSELAGCA